MDNSILAVAGRDNLEVSQGQVMRQQEERRRFGGHGHVMRVYSLILEFAMITMA